MKKIPQRMCLICKQKFPKNELTRVVKMPNGEIVVDNSGKLAGRGAYVCSSETCRSKLQKQRALNRAFKTLIDDNIYKALTERKNESKD